MSAFLKTLCDRDLDENRYLTLLLIILKAMVGVIVHELPERPKAGDVVELPNGQRVRVRDIGIPWILPPKRVCNDPLCPWHGSLSVRGKVIECEVIKVHPKFAVVLHKWLHYDHKYMRYERRRRKIHVRLPPCINVKPGDVVYICETRPLAKTIAHVIVGTREDVAPRRSIIKRLGETADVRL